MTIKDLAKAVGIPYSTLGAYTGSKKATYQAEHLLKLAQFFDVSTDYLLTGESRTTGLDELPTELFYKGWLKVSIHRAIPHKKGKDDK